jgi:hypothetical protein
LRVVRKTAGAYVARFRAPKGKQHIASAWSLFGTNRVANDVGVCWLLQIVDIKL